VALLYLNLANETTRAQRNTEESVLLRLPPELRRRIWTYAVHAQIVTVGDWDWFEREDYPKQSVLQVCRQLHAETCLLPYSNNSFWPHDIESLSVWLTRRLPEQIDAVQSIRIWCGDCSEAPLRLLRGIKYVHVYCTCDGLCPSVPARGIALAQSLEVMLGNSNLKIQITHG